MAIWLTDEDEQWIVYMHYAFVCVVPILLLNFLIAILSASASEVGFCFSLTDEELRVKRHHLCLQNSMIKMRRLLSHRYWKRVIFT